METPTFKISNPNIEDGRARFFIENGLYFGYPKCCIEDFVNRFPEPPPVERREIHNFKGFIPCKECCDKILSGKATLESLITNRICQTAFPSDGY